MSVNVDWRITTDRELTLDEISELFISSNHIPSMASLDELQECGGEAEFFTESNFATRDMREVMERFTTKHPDVAVRCFYHFDTAICPDGFEASQGKIREFTGEVRYTWDDNGQEVTP